MSLLHARAVQLCHHDPVTIIGVKSIILLSIQNLSWCTIFLCFSFQIGSSLSKAIESYADRHDREYFKLNIEQLTVMFKLVCFQCQLLCTSSSTPRAIFAVLFPSYRGQHNMVMSRCSIYISINSSLVTYCSARLCSSLTCPLGWMRCY